MPESMHWREWGGEYVVYSGARGVTHLLPPASGALFLALLQAAKPVTCDDLADQVFGVDVAESGEPSDREVAIAANSALLEFEQLGLARQIRS